MLNFAYVLPVLLVLLQVFERKSCRVSNSRLYAFNKTLHIAGIIGDFEAFSKKSHIRQVLLATLKPSARPGENYQEGESPTTTLSKKNYF